MSQFNITDFVTINSGSSVSNTFQIGRATMATLWAPVLTSCQVFIQGSYDVTSGNFVRAIQVDGSGDFAADLGQGSKMVVISDPIHPVDFIRLESSVTQTDTRTFAIIVKR